MGRSVLTTLECFMQFGDAIHTAITILAPGLTVNSGSTLSIEHPQTLIQHPAVNETVQVRQRLSRISASTFRYLHFYVDTSSMSLVHFMFTKRSSVLWYSPSLPIGSLGADF